MAAIIIPYMPLYKKNGTKKDRLNLLIKRTRKIIHFPPLGQWQCDLQMILAYQVDQASCLDTLTSKINYIIFY